MKDPRKIGPPESGKTVTQTPPPEPRSPGMPSFKKGGRVKRTGKARLHAGEVVKKKGKRGGRKRARY